MPSATARARTARASTTIAQLDSPSPNTITKTAIVPSTAATSLRAGATGRPFWFANVDLPVVTDRLGCRDHGAKALSSRSVLNVDRGRGDEPVAGRLHARR